MRQKAHEIGDAYGVEGFPTNYVIGPDGKVAARMTGYDEKKLRETLDRVAPKKK